MEYVFQFGFYNPKRPKIVLDTFGHENPWTDNDEILKSGMIAFDKNKEMLKSRVKNILGFAPDNIETYSMNVCNKLGRCEKSEFVFVVIEGTKLSRQ